MDKLEIYKNIKTIADELCKENKMYVRADLAFELKKYGIASDSSEVSKLVFDAYRYFHDNSNIAIAFVSNNSRTTLVAEYKLNDSLEQGNKEEALKIAETELALSSSALEQLKVAKTEHSHPLGMVVSTHFRCGKGVKRGLKNGALPFNID